MNTSKITKLALIAAATAVATIAVPATARADDSNAQFFQSPSGNIQCYVGMGHNDKRDARVAYADCTIQHSTYAVPSGQCHTLPWPQFELGQGDSPDLSCVVGERNPPAWPTLGYGQTRSLDSIRCDSEPSGVTCTDSSTGHFFRLSHESYDVG